MSAFKGLPVLILLCRPGTMWAQQLRLQEPQSTGSSRAVLVVPMGPLSPHPITDPPSQPTVLVSSSGVSAGMRAGLLQAERSYWGGG